MTKTTYEQKIETLDLYIKRPIASSHPTILTAIKADVVKANTKGAGKASELNNGLYNQCMGLYRQFLKSRDSHLRLEGRKAKTYKEAMLSIIRFIQDFARQNNRPFNDNNVLEGLAYMFKNWDRLNHYHRNRLGLPEIYNSIEEIIPMIKNGYDKKTAAKSELEQFENSIKRG